MKEIRKKLTTICLIRLCLAIKKHLSEEMKEFNKLMQWAWGEKNKNNRGIIIIPGKRYTVFEKPLFTKQT